MDTELFALAIDAAVTLEREKGIGTLSEGVLHSAVKYYYQPDTGLQEVNIDGFVCDAITETHAFGRTVIEVQTASFRNLKKKLAKFLPPTINTTNISLDAVNHVFGLERAFFYTITHGNFHPVRSVSRKETPTRCAELIAIAQQTFHSVCVDSRKETSSRCAGLIAIAQSKLSNHIKHHITKIAPSGRMLRTEQAFSPNAPSITFLNSSRRARGTNA